jgi:hypothetical protein
MLNDGHVLYKASSPVSAAFAATLEPDVVGVHEAEKRLLPLMIGSAPLPYAPNVIGRPSEPEDGTVSCSRQVQVFLKDTESPALKLEMLTLLTVNHGRISDKPELPSLPAVST